MIDAYMFMFLCLVAVCFSIWATDSLLLFWDWWEERKNDKELDRRFMEQEKEWKEVLNEDR